MSQLDFDPAFLRRMEQMSLLVKRVKAGRSQGTRRSPKKGSSVEFADFRNYTRGDDLRRVDWNAYARLNKLFLKLFVEEQDTTLHLLVDHSRSMTFGDRAKYRFALRVAAALSYITLVSYDRAAVALVGGRLEDMSGPVSGKLSWMGVWDFLGRHMADEGSGATDFGRSVMDFCARRPAPGVSIVISDLFSDTYQAGVKALQAANQEVAIIHVLGPGEVTPEVSGEIRLIDSETGLAREVSVTPGLIRAYQKRVSDYCDSVRRFSVSRGVSYIRATSDEPVENFVLQALHTAGLVH